MVCECNTLDRITLYRVYWGMDKAGKGAGAVPGGGAGGSRNEWDSAGVHSLRQHLGLTQAEMAEEMGVRQQTVSDWEVGAYQPRGASRTLLNIVAERSGFKYGTGDKTDSR